MSVMVIKAKYESLLSELRVKHLQERVALLGEMQKEMTWARDYKKEFGGGKFISCPSLEDYIAEQREDSKTQGTHG